MPEITPTPQAIRRNKYPSPAEIENYAGIEVQFPGSLVATVAKWKKEVWYPFKKNGVFGKLFALSVLVETLNEYYGKDVTLDIGPDCYQPDRNRILLVSPSIITTMHEYGHALYGDDELKACAYSIHLFKKCFPLAWEQLEWDGHVLRRREIPQGLSAEDVAGMEPDEPNETTESEDANG